MSKLGDNDPAVRALARVAEWVTSDMARDMVTMPVPKDSALGWKAASVHPLQILATQYQAIVNDATRGVTDFAARQRIESAAMSDFYFFDGSEPRLLGVGKGQGYGGDPFPLATDGLLDASKRLSRARVLATLPHSGPAIREAISAAYLQASNVLGGFHRLPMSDAWGVAPIVAAERLLANLGPAIAAIATPADVDRVTKVIAGAITQLEAALEGVGSVQMFYSIERFYLFRLLVRYKLHSDNLISAGEITAASSALTKLVTNGHAFLTEWLAEKIVDLGNRVIAADGTGNTLFFLKGGRALNYALGTPDLGTNDWDTQIVINPQLPAERWYAIFLRTSNAALLALKEYKTELYMLMSHHAGQFYDELSRAEGGGLPDAPVKPAETYSYSANVKAELIDVGLPRYDTVEAHEQWRTLRENILPAAPGAMPIPGYVYYINEYLTMVREFFSAASSSPDKLKKRLERLLQVLSRPEVDQLAGPLAQSLHAALPLSVASIAGLMIAQPIKNGLIYQLDHFYHAYRLQAEPRMAARFDAFFATSLPNRLALAMLVYPPGARQTLAAAETANPPELAPGCTELTDSVGFCQWVSNQMQAHLDARAAAVAARPELDRFERCLVANSIFSQAEELEIQLAGGFAKAAASYADYLQFNRAADLDPATYLALGIYCARANTDPHTVLEVVQPAVQQCLTETMGTLDVDDQYPAPPGVLRILWGEEMTFAPLGAYQPLAAEIAIHADPPRRPLLNYIWGLPVLSLRDLILEYQERAAEVDEFGMRARLTRTIAALSEMAMHAANVQPPNLTIDALIRNRCHHLMISSTSYAIARDGEYPSSYRPDRAFQLMMTGNRRAFAAQFAEGFA
ncbi:hypothetical protein [Sphingomonas sp. S2-65]|uniref:hypothetical protein n=1 Tax=Sphingomonas sp. S2-65 TaxID=2903960 RepID=UPI001F382C4A|nr:hypothetical protein [Sphingomonas sp. S2-65]UYY59377.1 hypothetical protein LZ586_04645 [Sphingomonas sp. S2-65]